MKRIGALLVLLLLGAALLPAQGRKKLTVDLAVREGALVSPGLTRVEWRPGHDEISYVRPRGGETEAPTLELYEAASGRERALLTGGGPEHFELASYQWSARGDELLVQGEKGWWLVNPQDGASRQVLGDPAAEDVTLSPTEDRVAYVRGNNLYALDVATGQTAQLTTSGSAALINGKLDWVYEEELANRATGRAYEWSPDGRRIAYLSLDDGPVPLYPLTHYLSTHVTLEQERFPQSGDPNPVPSFHVVTVANFKPQIRDYARPAGVEYWGPSFSWTPDSKGVAFLTLNRAQTDLAVHLWNPAGGQDQVLLTEHDPYWINSLDPPFFLADGRFLWLSERDGWLHLYLYGADGKLARQLTRGDWMIDHPIFSDEPFFEVDQKGGWVYFADTRADARQRQVDRVRLAGGGVQAVTTEPGEHSLALSPGGRYLLDTWSNVDTPPQVRLLKADGTKVATLDPRTNHLDEYALGKTEFVQIKAADGATLDARLLKPAGFDPGRKYPVIVYVYGGPHVQMVRDGWGATSMLDQLFAQEGFLVWTLDNRGSWGRGHAWESAIFEHMGQRELQDQLAGVAYLKSLPYVDPARLGLWGWSYGGYLTLFTLTHAPDVFQCGAAGGPVTDWKFYDSIYTERYMRTPEENPAGYHASSPLEAAANLKARLLLIHGTDDDNVHLQNTLNFIQALVEAHLPFRLYLQPGQKHGFRGDTVRTYLEGRLLNFFKDNL